MKVLLDTNFVMEAVKNRIDFEDIERYGRIFIPRQVLVELDRICTEGQAKDREISLLALKILKKSKRYEVIELENRYVDLGIEKLLVRDKDYIIATIDKELKHKLAGKARVLTIINRKKLVLT